VDVDAWASRPALPAQAAGKVNDPRATYDPFIGRWIVACSCSGDFLLVSGGRDATGPWKGAVLTGSAGDLTMFPGWDKNGVYISEFQLKLNSRVIALPSEDVAWKSGGEISLSNAAVFADRHYEMRPAVDPNPKKGPADPEYMVARSGPPQNATNIAMDLLVDRIAWSDKKASVSGPVAIPTGFLYNTPNRNLEHQQNLSELGMGVVVVVVPDNNIKFYRPFFPPLRNAAERVRPGQVIYVESPQLRA
jgi:hypothetical protein